METTYRRFIRTIDILLILFILIGLVWGDEVFTILKQLSSCLPVKHTFDVIKSVKNLRLEIISTVTDHFLFLFLITRAFTLGRSCVGRFLDFGNWVRLAILNPGFRIAKWIDLGYGCNSRIFTIGWAILNPGFRIAKWIDPGYGCSLGIFDISI